jgi:predicted nucleic acid-binding Zn ribbon protein
MGEIVDDQTANQAANPLKKEKKRKKNHQFWSSRIAVLVVLMLVL